MSEVLQPIRDEDIRDLSPSQLAERLSQFESMRLTQMSDAKISFGQKWRSMVKTRSTYAWGSMQERWGGVGEVTLVAGQQQAKSALSQMALHYSRFHPIGMMSLEEPFRAQVYRFMKQALLRIMSQGISLTPLPFPRDRIWHYKVYARYNLRGHTVHRCLPSAGL